MAKTIPPEQFDKENAVLELRRSGETWARIAEVVGYANASGAQKAYVRVVNRVQREPVEAMRDLELDRLDRLQRSYWKDAVVNQNQKAALLILKIIDQRAKIAGLYAPTKIQAEVINYDGLSDMDRQLDAIKHLITASGTGLSLSMEGTISEAGTTTSEE
jgi:hypothetical protein